MNRKKLVLIASAVVVVLAAGVLISVMAAGGGGSGSRTGAVSGAGTSTAAAPTGGGAPTGAAPGSAAAPGAVPTAKAAPTSGPRAGKSPGDATVNAQNGFMNELGAIDPGFLGDRDRMLNAGQATCQDIRAGKPQETLIQDATQRFKTGGVAITETKASLIVDAAHNHLCPGA